MSQSESIPVRDEKPQHDNSDKTAAAMGEPATPNAGTGREVTENKAGEEPSGYRGENPATAGPGSTRVNSSTPENADGRLDPSAPANTGITPATTGE